MMKGLLFLSIVSGTMVLSAPANAQIELGVGADVDLGVELRVGDPYTYDGYRSGRWYYSEYERHGRYYETYGGYDCHRGFQYTWHDDYRARYEAYWCFDESDRHYEVRRTRTVARVR